MFLQQQRLKAKRKGVLIHDFALIKKTAHIVMEASSRIGNAKVSTINTPSTPLRIGSNTYIRAGGVIEHVASIGRYCSIGRNVHLGLDPHNHPIDWVSSSVHLCKTYTSDPKPVVVGHDVWIGHNVTVMAGVTIGHGAVVGLNAVVTKDVEPYQIVVGSPAKPIRSRFDDALAERLLQSEWWDIDFDELQKLPLDNPEAFLSEIEGMPRQAYFPTVTISARTVVA